jgi:hypothetical protein
VHWKKVVWIQVTYILHVYIELVNTFFLGALEEGCMDTEHIRHMVHISVYRSYVSHVDMRYGAAGFHLHPRMHAWTYVSHMGIRCRILNIATLIASDASAISPESCNMSEFWNNDGRAPDQDAHQRSTDDAYRTRGDQLCISRARHMIASDANAQ